jgi:peptidoglycan/xylan/chitin deacetylase (PgdA/CDA1 family)
MAPRPAVRSRSRRLLGLCVLGALCLLSVLALQPLWAFGLVGRVFPHILWRIETREPLVALTFDDGPHPTFTPRVLEILGRRQARATFFLIAERALQRPDLVARIRAEGHEVGNHYSTRSSALIDTNEEFADKLALAGRVLGLNATRPRLFRPPGGVARRSQLELARRAGYGIVLGSAYPWDPARLPAGYIRWLVTKNLAPGTIVILHDGIEDPSRSIAALPAILEAGAARGLRFVTVGELVASGQRANDSRREASESGMR